MNVWLILSERVNLSTELGCALELLGYESQDSRQPHRQSICWNCGLQGKRKVNHYKGSEIADASASRIDEVFGSKKGKDTPLGKRVYVLPEIRDL